MEKYHFAEEMLRQQHIHRVSTWIAILSFGAAGLLLLSGCFRTKRKQGLVSAVLFIVLLFTGVRPAAAAEETMETREEQADFSADFRIEAVEDMESEGVYAGSVDLYIQWKNLAQRLPEEGEENLKIEYNTGNRAESLELDLGFGTPVAEQLRMLKVEWIVVQDESGSSEEPDGKMVHFRVSRKGKYCFSAADSMIKFSIGKAGKGEKEDTGDAEQEETEGVKDAEREETGHDSAPPEIRVSMGDGMNGNSLFASPDQVNIQVWVKDTGGKASSGIRKVGWKVRNTDTGEEKTELLYVDESGQDRREEWTDILIPDRTVCSNGLIEAEVFAEDHDGNQAVSKKLQLEIDGKAPLVFMDAPLFKNANGQQFIGSRTIKLLVRDRNFDTSCVPSVVTGVDDGYSFSGWTKTDAGMEGRLKFLKDGDYAVTFQACDLVGNYSEKIGTGTFTLDRTVPKIRIQGVQNQMAYNRPVIPVIRINDPSINPANLKYTLRGAKCGLLDVELLSDAVKTEAGISINMSRFAVQQDDIYTLSVQAADYAGNAASEEVVFTMDQNGSSYILSDATRDLVDRYYTAKPEELVLSEINACEVSYGVTVSKDGEPKQLQEGQDYSVEIRGGDGDWLIYIYRIFASNFQKEGVYHVEITSRDQASNVNNTQIRGARIDFVVDQNLAKDKAGNKDSMKGEKVSVQSKAGHVSKEAEGQEEKIDQEEEPEEQNEEIGGAVRTDEEKNVSKQKLSVWLVAFPFLILPAGAFFVKQKRKNEKKEK